MIPEDPSLSTMFEFGVLPYFNLYFCQKKSIFKRFIPYFFIGFKALAGPSTILLNAGVL